MPHLPSPTKLQAFSMPATQAHPGPGVRVRPRSRSKWQPRDRRVGVLRFGAGQDDSLVFVPRDERCSSVEAYLANHGLGEGDELQVNFGAVVGRDTWFDLSRLDEMYAKKVGGGLLVAAEEEGESGVPAKVVALQEQLKARLARYTELKDEKTRIKEEMSRLKEEMRELGQECVRACKEGLRRLEEDLDEGSLSGSDEDTGGWGEE